MLFRYRPRKRNSWRSFDPKKYGISIRPVRLVFFFLAFFLAFQNPRCLAAARSAIGSDGTTTSSVDLAAGSRDAPQTDAAARPDGPSDRSTAEETENAAAFTASVSALAVNDPPGAIVKLDENITEASRSRKCILFQEGLCRAAKNKPILALAAMQIAALVSDGITTRQFLRRGYTEVDPLTRILIGRKPTWGRMAPLGAVQVAAGMWLAERMATSQHVWVRRFWWLPQVMGIAGNAAAAAHNVTLH
jgi:hypothetical protein